MLWKLSLKLSSFRVLSICILIKCVSSCCIVYFVVAIFLCVVSVFISVCCFGVYIFLYVVLVYISVCCFGVYFCMLFWCIFLYVVFGRAPLKISIS